MMLLDLALVLSNFCLIQIFATTHYIGYFFALVIYIYFFNNRVNLLHSTIFIIMSFVLIEYLDEEIYDLYLFMNYDFKLFYIDDLIVYILSFLHIFILLLISKYDSLKKMSYN